MPVSHYERLRMTHRTLLKAPLSRAELRELLTDLPEVLTIIGESRPALVPEIEFSRRQLAQLEADLAHPLAPDGAAPAWSARLHRVLAGLFGP
ncbi:hypothetical protein [Hymenobacter jeollabukensis]|uniref:Uncharacterized protein n=1 Tax=Hymenobacter jeollabukensis TaxID=2025313 RepID=A0A5R8WWR0_9BACT|nr:hypothetical protein [Hymenobacter jeollabukensis]TLM96493.1 hypothetical protein FDY95_00390 [Hymenobacter jeollabukensis]